MKKLIFFIAFALLAVATMAQTGTAVSYVMKPGQTYYEYIPKVNQYMGGATTATNAGYDTLYFEIATNKNVPTNCLARVEVVRVGTADTYNIDLQAKLFENSTYAAILASAANTTHKELIDTIKYQLGTSAKAYRYYRVLVGTDNNVAATDSLRITKVAFKLIER